MSQVILLATSAGLVSAFFIWVLLAFLFHRSPKQQVYERLRELTKTAEAPAKESALSLKDRKRVAKSRFSRRVSRFLLDSGSLALLEQAGIRMSVWSLILIHACCGAAGFALASWFLLKPAVIILVTVAMGSLPLWVILKKRQERFMRLMEQLPEAIRLMTASLRAGMGLDSGLEVVATELDDPIRGEFKKLLNERRLISDPNEAFKRFAKRVPIRDYCLFSASTCLHREVGGNFAELLDQLEHTVRERFKLFREIRTLTAESRLSAWILGFLPLIVGIGIWFLNPSYFYVLWDNAFGKVLIWAAFILQASGFLVIRMIASPKVH